RLRDARPARRLARPQAELMTRQYWRRGSTTGRPAQGHGRTWSRRSLPATGPRNRRLRSCCTPTRSPPGLDPPHFPPGRPPPRPHGTEAAGPRAVAPYVPRAAADTVQHAVLQEHLETFLAAAAARTNGVGLPSFIEREFRAFLRCGVLAHGFLRVRCDDCAFERLVPLSCKGRAACASRRRARRGGAGGDSRRARPPLGARPAMGAHRSPPTALPPRLRPRALSRRHRGVRARRARLVPPASAARWVGRR